MSKVSQPSNLPKQPDLSPEGSVPNPKKGQPQPFPGYNVDNIKSKQG